MLSILIIAINSSVLLYIYIRWPSLLVQSLYEITPTPDHEYIHITTYTHRYTVACMSQAKYVATACTNMNWKPYALIEQVHGF